MRQSVLAGLGLVAALAAPAAAAPPQPSTGPFVGRVGQGQTATHVYDNNPSNQPCIALAATYTVSLAHVPATDTLTLSVGTVTATSTGGGTALNVTFGVCTRFEIDVTGTSVADSATYAVTVTRQLLPPLS
jgi:hypothetical protein